MKKPKNKTTTKNEQQENYYRERGNKKVSRDARLHETHETHETN